MSKSVRSAISILVSPAVLFWFLASPASTLAQKSGPPQCEVVQIAVSLEKGQAFQQSIGFLTLKLEPLKPSGWEFSLVDSKGYDYVYPVNPPLRFNGSQTLGAGYGDTAKTSLSHGRELQFLLTRADYENFEPLLDDALWPYQSKDPDHAVERYEEALKKLSTGLLLLTVTRSEISPEDQILSAQFKVTLTTPQGFEFDRNLSPRQTVCPRSASPAVLDADNSSASGKLAYHAPSPSKLRRILPCRNRTW